MEKKPLRDYSFAGYVTRNDIKCADGRTIKKDAFRDQDGKIVPLVWNHNHNDPDFVIGNVLLKNRPNGVYGYASLNDTEKGQQARALVQHGDVCAFSIYANHLSQKGGDVVHGIIREVSLVLAGANPGAYIDTIMEHSDEDGGSVKGYYYVYDENDPLVHSDTGENIKVSEKEEDEMDESKNKKKKTDVEDEEVEATEEDEEVEATDEDEDEDEEEKVVPKKKLTLKKNKAKPLKEDEDDEEDEDEEPVKHADVEDKREKVNMAKEATGGEKTVKDVFDELTDEQKKVVYFMIGQAVELAKKGKAGAADDADDEEDEEVKHNAFDEYSSETYVGDEGTPLYHSDMDALTQAAFADIRKYGGSFHDAFLAHAEGDYGIGNVELLFPDARAVDNEPEFIARQTEWVTTVLQGTRHLPYSRIKTIFADITEDEARARGYITGKLKKEEFFTLSKRETTPTTVYKKQRLDRDYVLDASATINVVTWLMSEIKLMLNEEVARAILIGDGREVTDPDKISETNIRPAATDVDLFTVKRVLTAAELAKPADTIEAMSKAHKDYRGTGTPVLFTTSEFHSDMLWAKDSMGRKLYDSDAQLCSALRVSKIVEVEVMENFSHTFTPVNGQTLDGTFDLVAVKLNLSDYSCGTDKGGEINSFDQFDIDYNQNKYLMETRMSGCLTKYHSCQSFWKAQEGAAPDGQD